MPLTLSQHGHAKIEPFLWGLLPDNQTILEQWARNFQVSPRNAFGLIAAVGEECAGAVQFVRPERAETIFGRGPRRVEWLDEAAVADRLRALRQDHSAWRLPRDTGQFSLAGAQPKTGLLFEDGRWGVPSGRVPTTHILKPPSGDLDGRIENEHFCLELGKSLGLPVVNSNIMHFRDELAIVIDRYDRVRTRSGWRRVHQEDMCQAFAIPPSRKYQSEGGPGIRNIVELLRTYSNNPNEDVDTFIDSVAFNWLIGGTDAHAKNYFVLINAERVRLAPFYDITSILPHSDFDIQKMKLAMKLGGEYRLRYIRVNHWRNMAEELRLDSDALIQRVVDFGRQIADHSSTVSRRMLGQGITNPTVPRLADAVAARAVTYQNVLRVA
jgi:serine/threonine-protein kinase HipA